MTIYLQVWIVAMTSGYKAQLLTSGLLTSLTPIILCVCFMLVFAGVAVTS